MKIGMTMLQDLSKELQDYLMSLPMEGKNEIPVYYRNEAGEVFFVSNYILRDSKSFEKTAPASLYRGGGTTQTDDQKRSGGALR